MRERAENAGVPDVGLIAKAPAKSLWWLLVTIAIAIPVVIGNAFGIVREAIHLWVIWDGSAVDWHYLVAAGSAHDPYVVAAYRFSPVAAPVFVVLAPLSVIGWRLLHVAAAFVFGDWRITALMLITFPFWFDFTMGNVLVFVALTGWWAYRGNRFAVWIWFALTLLMPRPLALPLTGWLLWRRPHERVPFAMIFVGHAVLVLATGLTGEWFARLVASGSELEHYLNIGPSRFIGTAWLPIGFALGAWLTVRGRLGLASVAISPYVLPYYLLMLVLELSRQRSEPMEPRR